MTDGSNDPAPRHPRPACRHCQRVIADPLPGGGPGFDPGHEYLPVTHALLQPHSLWHFAEHPALRDLLTRAVLAAEAGGTRFPHTLLTGPADSGKRTLAHAIAREFAAPVLEIDMPMVRCSEDLAGVLAMAHPRSVIVLSGLDAATAPALGDLARMAAGIALMEDGVARRGGFPIARDGRDGGEAGWWPFGREAREGREGRERRAERERGEGRDRRGHTIIATAREELPLASGHFGWIERRYFLERTKASELVRVRRAFERLGLLRGQRGQREQRENGLTPEAVELVAEMACTAGVRTVEAVAVVADWMRGEVGAAGDEQAMDGVLVTSLHHLIRGNPRDM